MNEMAGRYDDDPAKLLSDFLSLCNRAMAEKTDSFWYRQAKNFNRAVLGGANFRTIIYGKDPRDIQGTFTIHFDPDRQELSLLPPGDYRVAYTWKTSIGFLNDVVHTRPEWYLEHPIMLDWNWMADRFNNEVIGRIEGRSFVSGLLIGAIVGVLATALMSGERDKWRR